MISVLYVDDESALLEISKLYLEKMGDFTVDTAESAQTALEKLGAVSYDAIVSDYQMPGMDGIQFLKALRHSGDCTPFIIFTGRGREDVVIEAFNEGADFYLHKGGEPKSQFTELAHKVRQAVELRMAEKARRESEEKYRNLFNDAVLGIFRTTPAVTFEDINPAFARIYGYGSPGEMMAEIHDIQQQLYVNPEDWATVKYLLATEGEIRNFVVENRHRDGHSVWISINARAIRDETGKILYFEGTIEDITERERAEVALQESEENYRLLFENASEGILIAQGDRMLYCNPRIVEILDQPADILSKKPFTDFIHPDDRNRVLENHLRRMKGEKVPTGYAFRVLTRNGSERWVQINSTRITWSGKPASLSFINDVPDRKRTEEALRESEENYRTVFENTGTATVLIEENTVISLANDEFVHLSGFSKEEIEGKKCWTEFVVREDLERMISLHRLRRQNLEKALNHYEFRFVTKSGDIRHIYLTIDIIPGTKKSVASLLDITERKRAEEALRESEERYRIILDTSQEGIWALDSNFHISYINEKMAGMLGYPQNELLGRSFTDCIPKDELPLANMQVELRKKGVRETYERRFLHRNGDILTLLTSSSTLYHPDGTFSGSFAMFTDITERKRAEEVLRISEENYRHIFENAVVGFFQTSPGGKLLKVNPAFARMYGYTSPAEIVSAVTDIGDQLYADCRDREVIIGMLKETGILEPRECLVRHTDGHTFWVLVTARAVQDEDGNLLCFEGTTIDITAQKRAEKELQESERIYRTLLGNLPGFVYRCANDRDWTMEYISDGCLEITGYPPDAFIGNKILAYNDIIPPGFQKALWDTWQIKLENRDTFEEEYPIITKNGETRWVWERGEGIFSDGGGLLYLEGFITDITDRKNAEVAIRIREQSYRNLAENLPGIVYRVYVRENHRMQFFNNMLIHMTGYTESELKMGKVCSIDPLIIAEDRDQVISELDNACRENREFRVEYRITHKDGTLRFFVGRGRPTFDDTGLFSIDGIIQDITDQKRAEIALQESEARYSSLFHNNYSIALLIDPGTGMLVDANDAACGYYGFPREELLTRGVYDLNRLPKDKVIRDLERAKSEPRKHFFSRHYLASGEKRDVEIYSGPLLLQGKQLFYSIIHDITDRKYAEEALRMANRKLILLESTTRHDISNQLLAIGGYLELLHEEVPDPVLDPYFTLIETAKGRISNIIQFSKVYGQIGVDAPVWQDCRMMVTTATTDSRPGQVRVTNDLPAGGEVFADPLIVTVFYNLIDNALRHGEKTAMIRFSLENGEGNRVIVCEDDGIGVPVAEKEQIFGQGCGKNTGLGLFLAREILAITGITIKETGIPGRGARFEIVVPGAMWRSIGEDA